MHACADQAVTKRQATERANERHMRNQRTLFDVGVRSSRAAAPGPGPALLHACSLLAQPLAKPTHDRALQSSCPLHVENAAMLGRGSGFCMSRGMLAGGEAPKVRARRALKRLYGEDFDAEQEDDQFQAPRAAPRRKKEAAAAGKVPGGGACAQPVICLE